LNIIIIINYINIIIINIINIIINNKN